MEESHASAAFGLSRCQMSTENINMKDFAVWLDHIELAKHIEVFRTNDIDFDVLRSLGEDDLKELGLSLGDRKRLIRAIEQRTPGNRPGRGPSRN